VIIWVCGVFFSEFKVYIKVRQDYLTSAEHRLRASATTILVSAVPSKWLTAEALRGLYGIFPGGIRNIWVNRNFGELLDKIHQRDAIFKQLECAQTELLRAAKRAQKKQLENGKKKARKESNNRGEAKEEIAQKLKDENADAQVLAQSEGARVGGTCLPHTVNEVIEERVRNGERTFKMPIIGDDFTAVKKGFENVGQAGKSFIQNVGEGVNNQVETTSGFVQLNSPQTPDDNMYDQYGRYHGAASAYGA
jgi:calcium permeable stress-gated cation channel